MDIFMILFTLFAGITLSAQSAVNGTFSKGAGTIETAFLTFMTGSIFLFLIILFFGQGNLSGIMNAPNWQLSGVFMGVFYLSFTIVAIPRIGVIATNLTTIVGQLVIGLIIDHFGWFGGIQINLDGKRVLALAFMALALYFIYKGNTQTQTEKTT